MRHDLSTNARAKPLDPDCHPWERQPTESDEAYAMFLAYRDMPERRAASLEHHEGRDWPLTTIRWNSSVWSWGYRCFQFDRYMSQQDLDELIRYRRLMNKRQRDVARSAQMKVVRWLTGFDPAKLKPMEAARLLEVAVKMERDAAGAEQAQQVTPDAEHTKPETLADMAGIDSTLEADLALALHRLTSGR